MLQVKIKVCGMKYRQNMEDVLSLHPDYLGFIFYPGSIRFVNSLDADWINGVSGTKKTGIFVDAEPSTIQNHISRFGLQAVQLHGKESPRECDKIKSTGVETIKAFGINEGFDWDKLEEYADSVDYFLFDTKTAGHGGSGRTFDWTLLQSYTLGKPYFLSGGLQPDNLRDALELVDERLYALDLNSRFESQPGQKDISLLKKAFQTIRNE